MGLTPWPRQADWVLGGEGVADELSQVKKWLGNRGQLGCWLLWMLWFARSKSAFTAPSVDTAALRLCLSLCFGCLPRSWRRPTTWTQQEHLFDVTSPSFVLMDEKMNRRPSLARTVHWVWRLAESVNDLSPNKRGFGVWACSHSPTRPHTQNNNSRQNL